MGIVDTIYLLYRYVMKFSLRQLEVFANIARTLSVSAAAETLGMSQSAASTALGELERRAGQRLFDRTGKSLKLNETGMTILPMALELLSRAWELDGRLAGNDRPGPLRLGATVTIGNYVAPRLIERYRASYPDATITLSVGNSEEISHRIAEFDLDYGMVEGQYGDSRLHFDEWMQDELVVFCGPRHHLAGDVETGIEALLAEQWAVREKGSGTRQALDRAMAPYWGHWRIGIELQQMEAIKGVVEAGMLIGCLPRLALIDAFNQGRLVELSVPELALMRKFYLVTHREKYRTVGMNAFAQICLGLEARS